MSEKIVAVLLSFGLLGGMFFWVPLLEVVCPPCSRLLRSRRRVGSRAVDAPRDTSAETVKAA